MPYDTVRGIDPAVADALAGERERQSGMLAMMASKSRISEAVMEAQSSELTSNYAEDCPGSRYYGGCEYAGGVEQFAIDRAGGLWGAEHVNIQLHSGLQANMGVFPAAPDPDGKILSLDLTHGGRLNHGHLMNIAGKTYEAEQYEANAETGYVDYDQFVAKAETFDPDITISGYSAYPREIEWERIQTAADSVDAYCLADVVYTTGLVATDEHSSPASTADFVISLTHEAVQSSRSGIIMRDEEHADDIDSVVLPGLQGGPILHNVTDRVVDFGEALALEFEEYVSQVVDNTAALGERSQERGLGLVSEGADTCLVLVDPRPSYPDTTGKDVGAALEEVGIVLSTNTVPGKSRPAFNPSGVCADTPVLTIRGFGEKACRVVADLIYEIVDVPHDESVGGFVDQKVDELTAEYSPYNRPAIGSVRLEPNVFSIRPRPDSEG